MRNTSKLTRPAGSQKPDWTKAIVKKWKYDHTIPLSQQGKALIQGIKLLNHVQSHLNNSPLALLEQPFDLHLLNSSFLYRKSRKVYKSQGGRFLPTLVSSARTLSSPILLEQEIEYSPIEKEFIWRAVDPIESRHPDRLLALRNYSSSLFHEQSHRILWRLLPPAPSKMNELRRFLNFAESLVITTDMALGDELGPNLAPLFYLLGVTYDPGTNIRCELSNRREYRNYLQAALHATYLNLELFDSKDILKIISALFPSLKEFAKRAAIRSGNLDSAFIYDTNLNWQKKHYKTVVQKLGHSERSPWILPEDPLDNREQYLFAEQWFDSMGL